MPRSRYRLPFPCLFDDEIQASSRLEVFYELDGRAVLRIPRVYA
ncbi:MAG: hypothetical protein QOH58_846 [Thermoleophilaceae bacterium]|nr:hypothetical protein [Thermoleophilaceae bacterium]